MKVYAKQIDPEYQEIPLFIDGGFPDSIVAFGNRDFFSHTTDVFDKVYSVLEQGELAEALEYPKEWKEWYKSATEAITDYLPPENKSNYSNKDIHTLRRLVIDYSCCACSKENDIICKVISIVSGKKWDYRTIRGSCQGEWQEIFYPVDDWEEEDLKRFETEYFNEGSEWIVCESEFDPKTDSAIDICGYSIYCTSWSNDGIKREIASAEGVMLQDVILYTFGGYTKTPKYKEV